MSILFLGLE